MENRDPNELLHEDKPAQSCLQSCLQAPGQAQVFTLPPKKERIDGQGGPPSTGR